MLPLRFVKSLKCHHNVRKLDSNAVLWVRIYFSTPAQNGQALHLKQQLWSQ